VSTIQIVEAFDDLEGDRVKGAIARLASGSIDGLRHFLEAVKIIAKYCIGLKVKAKQ